jgi:transposase InsO family protein
VARRPKKSTSQRYPFELKLRAVKLYLEEGFSQTAITEELGLGVHTVAYWTQRYQAYGEEGLKRAPANSPSRRQQLPQAVTDRIVALKKENPSWGIKTISQWLRRILFLQASPETVRQKLHQANLLSVPPAPRKRNLTRPRFFERATPNQMWQSDIFTFRLGGRYAYVVAFLDDYSRFIVGADLFRSPTAEAVIEVYRQAVAEYKPPKEMLTDNGRQYTSWRGTSRFEAELKKDGVAHFKSRPQHPMTLGKIERFWETLWQQFLTRAQFASFEEARERIRFWIKHYNHKRPNQGIGGLCPADRFFEIQSALRQTIEAGIKENLLEIALRGQPRAPFYMVGRMEGQSVVLRAEKGKLKLEVSDPQNHNTKELIYELNQNQQQSGQDQQVIQTTPENQPPLQRDGESPGSAGRVDRTLQSSRSLPPDEHHRHDPSSVAAARDGRHASSIGDPSESGPRRSPESPVTEFALEPGRPSAPVEQTTGANPACIQPRVERTTLLDEPLSTPSHSHPSGPGGPVERRTGGPTTGHLPSALLHLGETRPQSAAPCSGGSTTRSSQREIGPGEAEPQTPGESTGSPNPTLPAERTTAPEAQGNPS